MTSTRRTGTRPRSYDLAILRYLARHRMATSHQVIYRFWLYAGRGPSYGYRTIRNLVKRNLVRSDPLDPALGAVSRSVLTPTPAGWAMTPERQLSPRQRRVVTKPDRDNHLQWCDVLLEREATGWSYLPREDAYQALRGELLARFRDRRLDDHEVSVRDRIARFPAPRMPLGVLTHRDHPAVRAILPVRRGLSYMRRLRPLEGIPYLRDLRLEIVCSDEWLFDDAEPRIKRWAARAGLNITFYRVAPYRLRPHPNAFAEPRCDRYARHGVSDPRSLI